MSFSTSHYIFSCLLEFMLQSPPPLNKRAIKQSSQHKAVMTKSCNYHYYFSFTTDDTMCGVRVSTSCFLIKCLLPLLDCGFKYPLGLEFSDFSMWHFQELGIMLVFFPRYSSFPLLHWSTKKTPKTKCDFNSVKINSRSVSLHHMAHNLLRLI